MPIKIKSLQEIQITSNYRKSYSLLPLKIQKITDKKVFLFQNNPYHPSLKTHQLHGKLALFKSFTINQKYRIIFQFIDNWKVIFFDIGSHKIYQ